jgi:hypothetical protein
LAINISLLAELALIPQIRPGMQALRGSRGERFSCLGFSRPNAQAHDEWKSEFIVAIPGTIVARN